MKRNFKLLGLSGLSLLLLTACGTGEVTASSTNGWDQIVYFFAKAIQWLSINGRIGVGIVLFTIVIRTLMMPLCRAIAILQCADLEHIRVVPTFPQGGVGENKPCRLLKGQEPFFVLQDQIIC